MPELEKLTDPERKVMRSEMGFGVSHCDGAVVNNRDVVEKALRIIDAQAAKILELKSKTDAVWELWSRAQIDPATSGISLDGIGNILRSRKRPPLPKGQPNCRTCYARGYFLDCSTDELDKCPPSVPCPKCNPEHHEAVRAASIARLLALGYSLDQTDSTGELMAMADILDWPSIG